MKKSLALLLSVVMTVTLLPFSAFGYDGEIKDFEFTPDDPFTEYFETDGWWDTDEESQDYFCYSYVKYGEGDKLTIIDNDDNRFVYTAKFFEDGYYFLNEETGDRIKFEGNDPEVEFIDEQNQVGKHLQLGENNNTLFIEYKGIRKAIPVTIVQNPVASFEFIPVEPFTVIENTNGSWEDDDEYGHFFNYDSPYFREGDKISVVFTGETNAVEYTYRDVDYSFDFYDENDEIIPYADTISRNKHNEPWATNVEHTFTVEYSGLEFDVPITVVSNPVTKIDYIRAGTDEYIEGNTRYDSWDDKYYYEHPNFKEGDKLIVYEGQKITEYTCKKNAYWELYFESADGSKTIQTNGENGVTIDDSQRFTPWVLGNSNEFYINYMGQQKTLYATVKANPVKSISYTRAEPITYYEGTEGYDYGDGFEYRVPWERTGDKITVTDTNNVSTVYTCTFNDKTDQTEFVASNGDVLSGEVRFYSDQKNNPWVVGTDNEYYVTYSGKSVTLYVTIKANPVKSLQYTRSKPAVYYENSNGWEDEGTWFYNEPDFLEGDTLVITYTDDSTKAFTYQHSDEMHISAFFAADGEMLDDIWTTSNQYQSPWGKNTNNVYYVEYLSKLSNPVNVTIIENNTKSISVVKASPATVIDGDTREDISPVGGMHYMAYDIPGFVDGDKLIVTNKDDSVNEYVFSEVEIDGRPEHRFVYNGEILEENEINLYHEQFITPWSVDGDNYFYVEFRGKTCTVPVSVVSTDVKSISFTLAKPDELVFAENSEGFYDWSHKDFTESTLTVNYKDNTQKVYALKFDFGGIGAYFENVEDENDRLYQHDVLLYDFQNENRWTPDSDNALYMRYKGVTCNIPV
ncbi:MAG: hypothetical protein IKS12_06660, partial [Eubacterium sp.]|nr:hypothetical protein [Eubacterium sp.]